MGNSRYTESVSALLALLRRIIERPEDFRSNPGIRKALSSQGECASFTSPIHGITGMSLNTQKGVSERIFGSYHSLNELRRRALSALVNDESRVSSAGRNSKKTMAEEIARLRGEVRLGEEDLGRLTFALSRVSELARVLANDVGTKEAEAYCKKELRAIHLSLSARHGSVAGEATNVAHIRPSNART